MFKIIELSSGKTVIDRVDDDYVGGVLCKAFEVEYERGIPEHCWLSLATVDNFNRSDEVQQTLAKYVRKNAQFIDADANNERDVNETGCYFGFQRIKHTARFHVRGTLRKSNVVLPSFLVKVFDHDLNLDDYCGFGFTDEQGRFDVAFEKEDFSTQIIGIDFEGLPELYLHVAELDLLTGTFRTVKRQELPKTWETVVEVGIDLAE